MMQFFQHRQHRTTAYLVGGLVSLMLSGQLIALHAQTIASMKTVSVPLIRDIPRLEQHVASLQEQSELTELSLASRIGSQQERVRVFALPAEPDVDRLVAFFEVFADVMRSNDRLSSLSDVDIGEPVSDGSLNVYPVSFRATLHDDALSQLLFLLRTSGLFTIGDVLTEDELDLLLDRMDDENPAGIVAIEQFLSTDLLRYAQDPKLYEAKLEKSFSGQMFLSAFRNVVQTSALRDVRRILGGDLGRVIDAYKLWPLQAMTIESVALEAGGSSGWQKAAFDVRLYTRIED